LSPLDTNLSSSSALPRGFLLEWYEPWIVKMVRQVRRQVAEQIEEVAHKLGLEDFRSTVRRDKRWPWA